VSGKIWLGGQARISLGGSDGHHVPLEQVAEFIGEHELDDPIQQVG
jgi:hypothetical protein